MAEAFSLSLTPPQMASLSGAAAASSRLLPRARLGFSTSSSTPSPSSLSLSSLKCLRSSPLLSHLLHRQVLFLSIFVSIFLCDCIDSEPHFLFFFFCRKWLRSVHPAVVWVSAPWRLRNARHPIRISWRVLEKTSRSFSNLNFVILFW